MSSFLSEIDYKRFGINIAKINEWGDNPQELINQLRAEGIKLVISRLPTEDVQTINKLENLGFQFKDSQITYKFDIKRLHFDTIEIPPALELREVVEKDVPIIKMLAKQSFQNYGHYSNNPRLDQTKVDEIYEDWAANNYNNKQMADKFFVVASKDDIAGFLSWKLERQGNTRFLRAIIGAVSEKFRNQGIFQILVRKSLLWAKEYDLAWAEYNALSINYPVAKVYTNLGFYIAASQVTLHGWLD